MFTKADHAVAVLDAHFQERLAQVPVLAQRAGDQGIAEIRSVEDVIPLLFPHTTYKSYPESLVTQGRWAQMNRWLDSLSTHRVIDVDVTAIEDVDGWIDALADAGHFVASSSGTSGKGSFLNASQRDRDASAANVVDCIELATGFPPSHTWQVIAVGPETGVRRHNDIREAVIANYARADNVTAPTVGPPPTGHHRYMARLAAMRTAMADGTAQPDDVAAFEHEAAERRANLETRMRLIAEQVTELRNQQIFFLATFPMLFEMMGYVRELGGTNGSFTGTNVLMTGGGLKGITLPVDYREQIFAMFGLAPSRFLHYYSMQELNQRFPKCIEGRYHVPDTVVMLVLDKEGETLAPMSDGQVEGRAAFCDTTIDGRWGGTISGDHIRADYGTCSCGRPGPTVFDEITRYSDLPDGDKITCAGTMDAYVRGFIEE